MTLSEVKNPRTNQLLEPISIYTYEDPDMEYVVDFVGAYPLLECNYPCERCSPDKSYCYKCWEDDPLNFLMTTEEFSTCKEECDLGYTTNGDERLQCIKCDDSCASCPDDGFVGDA